MSHIRFCGIMSFLGLVCLGLCLGELSIYFSCWWKAGTSRSAAVWKMVPICILWCVWKERNLRCFEDLENSMENLVASFLHLLYIWMEAFCYPCLLAFLIFLFVFLCLLRRFLVYTSSVLRRAPYAFFIKFHLLIKKKKIKTFAQKSLVPLSRADSTKGGSGISFIPRHNSRQKQLTVTSVQTHQNSQKHPSIMRTMPE